MMRIVKDQEKNEHVRAFISGKFLVYLYFQEC